MSASTLTIRSAFTISTPDIVSHQEVLPNTQEDVSNFSLDSTIPIPVQEEDSPSLQSHQEKAPSNTFSCLHSTQSGPTLFSSVINLVNTIVGAGMLGTPYALAQLGIVLGLW